MNMLRASSHQGALKFRGRGKQCVVNSLQAIFYNYSSPPRFWETKDVDDILERGDETYIKIAQESQYLCFSDVPQDFSVISDGYHGTINGKQNTHFIPYVTL